MQVMSGPLHISSPFLGLLLLALQILSLSASTSGSAYQPSLTFVLLSWRSSTHSWCSREKRTSVFRAAVLQPAGSSFHPVLFCFFFFFFWLCHAPCGIFLCTGSRETTGHPREGPSTGVYQGPFPSFPDILVCLWGSRKSHSGRSLWLQVFFRPASPWQHLAFHGPLTFHP